MDRLRSGSCVWSPHATECDPQPVKLSLEVVDRPGVLRDIAEVISNMGLNMRATHSSRSKRRTGTQTIALELEVDQATQIVRALARLDALPAVLSARRIGS